ncbi:hypothetical protein HanRHA438_Chr08g0333241 [Helianthus annuus]|nr:hypothetical protein HanRHA438_Chr08g0333241 [Helianthus annuus]
MASDQNMAGQTLTNNNLALGAGSGTTPLSSPAVTRSLDPEFEAEGPPPGFDNITTVSSQAVVTNPFLYMPSQTPPGKTEGTGGSAFAPGTAVFSQTSRLYSTPVITSASPSILVSETILPNTTNRWFLIQCHRCIQPRLRRRYLPHLISRSSCQPG